MRLFAVLSFAVLAGALALAPAGTSAQSALNLNALQGLIPVSVLLNTAAGRAALAKNLVVTGEIQDGAPFQPNLLPFKAQEEQALKDAFITGGNARGLADGLGTQLNAVYQSLAACTSPDDGKTSKCDTPWPGINALIGYTNGLSAADSTSGKYFFGNLTAVAFLASPVPVSQPAADLIAAANGTVDVYGKAYNHPAGSPSADPYGNSRPFQTRRGTRAYSGSDYFDVSTSNLAYLSGPIQPLGTSPSFPSGHTTYGYSEALLLAIIVPQRFPQMIARAAEYGNNRIIIGAHYAMDVLAGRTLATYDVAHLLAENSAYLGRTFNTYTIADYRGALSTAKTELVPALEKGCGGTLAACAVQDIGRFRNALRNKTFYDYTQTYGLPVVYPATAGRSEDVAAIAPEAGYVLTAAFPKLTLAQADQILTATEGPGGGFLDNGSAFGLYSRLNLYAAGIRAQQSL